MFRHFGKRNVFSQDHANGLFSEEDFGFKNGGFKFVKVFEHEHAGSAVYVCKGEAHVFHLGIFVDNEAVGNGRKVEFFPVAFVIYLRSEVFFIGSAENGVVYEQSSLQASVAAVVFFKMNNSFFVAGFATVIATFWHRLEIA